MDGNGSQGHDIIVWLKRSSKKQIKQFFGLTSPIEQDFTVLTDLPSKGEQKNRENKRRRNK